LEVYQKGDFQTALLEWRPLAEEGDPCWQYFLSLLFEGGYGVSQNLDTAIELFTLPSEQGVSYAQYSIGAKDHFGQGAPQNYDVAIEWHKLLLSKDNQKLNTILVGVLKSGKGSG